MILLHSVLVVLCGQLLMNAYRGQVDNRICSFDQSNQAILIDFCTLLNAVLQT